MEKVLELIKDFPCVDSLEVETKKGKIKSNKDVVKSVTIFRVCFRPSLQTDFLDLLDNKHAIQVEV